MRNHRKIAMFVFSALAWNLCARAAGQHRKAALEADIRELYNVNTNARAQAASRLVEAGPAAIALLVPVICDRSKLNFDAAWPAAAKALGELKAEVAVPCLVQMLGNDPTMNVFKPDKTLVDVDPAFAALVEIGEPVVPTVRRYIHILHYDQAYLALRVLRVINTPPAKQAAEEYVQALNNQIRRSKEVIEEFK
jgi:hypothetical protein